MDVELGRRRDRGASCRGTPPCHEVRNPTTGLHEMHVVVAEVESGAWRPQGQMAGLPSRRRITLSSRAIRGFASLLALGALVMSSGCAGNSPELASDTPTRGSATSSPTPPGAGSPFSLQDVNPNSPTSGRQVSPSDYVQRVSAWYFGHAT